MFCPKCGASNDEVATFCKACGEVLPLPTAGFQKAQGRMEEPAGIIEYYKAAIGQRNQDYYLKHFARFDAEGKASATWHWPAFWATFYWLLYRKIWLFALAYFFVPYLFWGLLAAVAGATNSSVNMLVGIGYVLYFVVIVFLIPMYANALYYNHCKKRIVEAKASSPDVQRQLGELAAKGGTSKIAIIVLLIFMLIAVLGIVAAVAIPAYQDYTNKARVAQAYELGRSAADSVTHYYSRNQMFPGGLGEAGFAAALPSAVSEIELDSQSGKLTVKLTGAAINGHTLVLEPALDEGRQLHWRCMSPDIRDRLLPRNCQKSN